MGDQERAPDQPGVAQSSAGDDDTEGHKIKGKEIRKATTQASN